MKSNKIIKIILIFSLVLTLSSCSNNEGEPTQSFAFSLTKQGRPYQFNYKLGIANPKTLGISLSKLSSNYTTPANLSTNPIQGCGIALSNQIANDVHIAIQFNEISLNTNIYLSDGVYNTIDNSPNANNSKHFNLIITEYRTGFVPIMNTSGTLNINKNNQNNSVNIKGTVTLSNGESISFPVEGLDVPFNMCQ